MGKDQKDKQDPIEDASESLDDTVPPPGSTDGEQTVVDDKYLADLGARLEAGPGGSPGADGPLDDTTSKRAPVRKRRPSYEDVSTEKLEGEDREKGRRRRRTSSYPAPAPGPAGELVYILCGPDAGRTFTVGGDKVRVGRGQDNDLVLNDTSVSRHHIKLTRAVDGWLFEDLGSENGTYLDDEYTPRGKVLHGQPLEVGRTILVFEKGKEP